MSVSYPQKIFSICKDQLIRPRVTLARTCRTFKEPALDILWENIDGFEPLISCLPEGVAVITNTDTGTKLVSTTSTRHNSIPPRHFPPNSIKSISLHHRLPFRAIV
ncbi:uncharacterized protein BJ212DRAFT_1281054 [Suillus subaureus]|uniref:F-box domain-containing protein n=1 Tax=Suillus subaureus TaxID=48587 RepID=A0A9P7E1G7_9AGAM|nr:uncharacterized protein BJ212DRAFT_1281054 [Suillus subaureus]KAG1808214.1 hypothetical protein BJ212DRAFT_1281054 [Suillus subaureus]